MGRTRVGIVGCGTIGSEIARALVQRFREKVRLVALCDRVEQRVVRLAAELGLRLGPVRSPEVVRAADLIVEAASAEAAAQLAPAVLAAGKSILVMSVGGLLRDPRLVARALQSGGRLYVPSGAIAGLDAAKAARQADVTSVTLTTRKPPRGLAGAPYVVQHNIDLDALTEETTIFEGNALDAVAGFPANVNVAAALSLASVGPEKTRVRIVACPDSSVNSHEIEIVGSFGQIVARTENVPAPGNPKTSYLAVLSAIATLDAILSPVRVGT